MNTELQILQATARGLPSFGPGVKHYIEGFLTSNSPLNMARRFSVTCTIESGECLDKKLRLSQISA